MYKLHTSERTKDESKIKGTKYLQIESGDNSPSKAGEMSAQRTLLGTDLLTEN